MKVERKVSDFSAEKRKRNGNMETETEFCKTETKMEYFVRKRKWKRNSVFRRNGRGNGNSVSGIYGISVLGLMGMAQSNFAHYMIFSCIRGGLHGFKFPYFQSKPGTALELGNNFVGLLEFLRFFCKI